MGERIEINGDLVKALRCIGSQDGDGDCYMEYYNLTHSGPGISCGPASDCRELCPHYQNKYEVCFEDGLCGEWLTQLADRLEELLPDRRGGGE